MSSKKTIFEKLTGSDLNDDEILSENEDLLNDDLDLGDNDNEILEERNDGQSLVESDTGGQLTIDVYQTENEIVIKSTIAGVKPENLDVSINNDMVTIKGERKNEEKIESGDYFYQECYWGSFSRSVILPVDVENDKAEAVLKDGVLTVRLPKVEKVKSKKLQVKGA